MAKGTIATVRLVHMARYAELTEGRLTIVTSHRYLAHLVADATAQCLQEVAREQPCGCGQLVKLFLRVALVRQQLVLLPVAAALEGGVPGDAAPGADRVLDRADLDRRALAAALLAEPVLAWGVLCVRL